MKTGEHITPTATPPSVMHDSKRTLSALASEIYFGLNLRFAYTDLTDAEKRSVWTLINIAKDKRTF